MKSKLFKILPTGLDMLKFLYWNFPSSLRFDEMLLSHPEYRRVYWCKTSRAVMEIAKQTTCEEFDL